MKKFISVILLIAVLVSLCACAKKEEAAAQPAATLDPQSPEAMYGHIDQTQKLDGVYKIWNKDGVLNMLKNPGDSFELLCHVDMQGETIAPIAEFTGTLTGQNCTIKNFTVQGGSEESFGFICVNKGKINNLYLDNVTFIPGANAKNVGTLVGSNEGTVSRCTVTAAKLDASVPANANVGNFVGLNTGSITNSKVEAELSVKASGAANVGAIVGKTQGGKVEYIETSGKMDITGGTVAAGMFAGEAADVTLLDCVFLCESNTVDGKLIETFTGNEDDELVTCPGALYRDNGHHAPLTPGQEKLRQRVVDEMNAMGLVEWRLHQDLAHSCTCSLGTCHGIYNTTETYVGIPYNHKGGSLSRMYYIMDDEGYIKDWAYDLEAYDGFDMYMGNDCSTALAHAWWTVSNTTDFSRCTYEVPQRVTEPNVGTGLDHSGCYPVGNYATDFTLTGQKYTDQHLAATGEQGMYEAYACIRKGDGYVYMIEAGGHTRMAVADAVVVRDQQGLINPNYSFVISTEQGSTTRVEGVESTTQSTWKVNYKYTFANLYYDWAIPVTCIELMTGEMDTPECEMIDGVEGYYGLFNGTVKGNFYLDSVDLEIKNSKGETVFFHTYWTTVDKRHDIGHNDALLRNYEDELDMVAFSVPLSKFQFEVGETYSYSVTGHLHTYDDFVVHESSFTYGEI